MSPVTRTSSERAGHLPSADGEDEATQTIVLVDDSERDPAASGSSSLQPSSPSVTHNFRCDRCPRAFTRRENLSRHAKTHSAPWAHRCRICGKGFARSDSLNRHEASHQRWAEQGQDSSYLSESTSNKRRKIVSPDDVTSSVGSFDSPDHVNTNTPMSLDIPSNGTEQSQPVMEQPAEDGAYPDLRSRSGLSDTTFIPPLQPSRSYSQTESHQGVSAYGQVQQSLGHGLEDDSELMSFDFTGFLLPTGDDGLGDFSYEWFSNDFYSAMHETGNEQRSDHWEHSTGLDTADHGPLLRPQDFVIVESNAADRNRDSSPSNEEVPQNKSGRLSRISSPPNEASEEDKWAFAWDPKSRAILHADPISIPPEHPFWKQHNPRFDINESTFGKLQKFLSPIMHNSLHNKSPKLPSLSEVNILIGLYFEHFSHRMPVLHHPTVNTNEDLPPPLLGAILVIGAIYSRLQGTRRFAIVLLDIVRWHLQLAIEYDNSLMRDPSIMFAEALICYAGLWCGNKRAFELAEVLRATVVKHVRSAQFWRGDRRPMESETSSADVKGNLAVQWREWASKESQRRLFWVIYTIDVQFTSLLYLPATVSMGEVRGLCCPCDEDFWSASTARHWKSLLGPAMVPPSRVFSAAAVPFLWSQWDSSQDPSRERDPNYMPVLALNDWSAFLVLITLQGQIYQFSQERLFADSYFEDEDKDDSDELNEASITEQTGEEAAQGSQNPISWQKMRRKQFADSITMWHEAYLLSTSKYDSHATSVHFRNSSMTGHTLAFILLDIPFPDLQDALGKNGKAGIKLAMHKLKHWIHTRPQIAEDTVFTAIRTIANTFATKRVGPSASEQLIITLFLSYVIVWIFASITSSLRRKHLLERLAGNEDLWKLPQLAPIIKGLEFQLHPEIDNIEGGRVAATSKSDVSRGIFRSAASCLTQLGTWGAALNLALLLHWRSEM